MSGVMRRALALLREQAAHLRPGDYLSFAFFSGVGEWSYPIKAFQYTGENLDALQRMFDTLRPPFNLTNFSGVLREAVKVIDALGFLNARHVLWFHSDGFANDPGVTSEHRATEEIITSQLAERLSGAMTVAHGDWCDKPFLARMAQLLGGEMVTAGELEDMVEPLTRFIESSAGFEPRVEVEVPEGAGAAFTLPAAGGVTLYAVEDGEASVVPAEGVEYLYVVTDLPPARGLLEIDIVGGAKPAHREAEAALRGRFAAAVLLSQTERRDEAIEVLGRLGDVALVSAMTNAFTPTEAGAAERLVAAAVTDPAARFAEGYKPDAVPPRDAFCLLDALALLQADATARLHPRHPGFRYKRTGRGTITEPGYPEFVPVSGANAPLSDFVWHKEKLNLSVRVRLAGTILLPDAAEADGNTIRRPDIDLPELFETFQWKTYTLVEGGFLHTTRLPVSCSAEAFDTLRRHDLVEAGETWAEGGIYVLRLDAVPVINRAMADGERSAKPMCSAVMEALKLEAANKVFKALREELDPEHELVQRTPWTVEQQRFLLAVGLREDGSFDPPSKAADKTDHRDVPRFRITVKGLSSLPSLADVRERIAKAGGSAYNALRETEKGKALTPSMRPMAEALLSATVCFGNDTRGVYEPLPPGTLGTAALTARVQALDEWIARNKRRLAQVRAQVQRPKFVITLTHTWFTDPEMTPRNPDGNKLTVDGAEFTVRVDTERVYI
jgi:hypothetical protein